MVATSRNVDVDMKRKTQAQWIFDTENYYHDKDLDQIDIISAKGYSSVVNINLMSCSCFANSRGVNCYCLLVMETIQPVVSVACNEELTTVTPLEKPTTSTDKAIKRNLDEISLFVLSDNFQDLS